MLRIYGVPMEQIINRGERYSPPGRHAGGLREIFGLSARNCDCRLPVCVCPSTTEFGSSSVNRSLTVSITSPKCSATRKCTFDDSSLRGSNCHPSSIDASTPIARAATPRTVTNHRSSQCAGSAATCAGDGFTSSASASQEHREAPTSV